MADDTLLRLSGQWHLGRAVVELALESLPGPRADQKLLPPGSVAPLVTVTQEQLQLLLIASLGSAYVATDASPLQQVIWYDHDGEVLVNLDRTMIKLGDGLVLVALTLETDQTGAGQLTVPLGVGSSQLPAGLVVVTESRPRGPVVLADRWGQAATAAAWRALLDATHALALQAGTDTSGARLVPGAISCDPQSFSVLPQARHVIDAVPGR